jgi:hypothetical protein
MLFATACGSDPGLANQEDQELAIEIAIGLSEACPPSARDDEAARLACGDALARFTLLRDTMAEPFLWGGQGAGKPPDLAENHLTRFNPLVWRKMYASLMMFGSDFRIETRGTQTLLRIPQTFRGALDMGSYPYPFWHSKGKWDSYQLAKEVLLVIEGGRLLGGMRSEEQDPTLPYVSHTFDGNWNWTSPEGTPRPASSMLYSNLFSPTNVMVPELERTYRALEEKARPQNCNTCHSPDNAAKMPALVLLNYPNQAIFARDSIVSAVETLAMPTGGGIKDQAKREELLALARDFQAAARQALALEGEHVTP